MDIMSDKREYPEEMSVEEFTIDEPKETIDIDCNIFSSSLDDLVEEVKADITEKLEEMYVEELNKIQYEIFKNCKENGYFTSDTAAEIDNITKDIMGLIGWIHKTSESYPNCGDLFLKLFTTYFGRWVNFDYTDDLGKIE